MRSVCGPRGHPGQLRPGRQDLRHFGRELSGCPPRAGVWPRLRPVRGDHPELSGGGRPTRSFQVVMPPDGNRVAEATYSRYVPIATGALLPNRTLLVPKQARIHSFPTGTPWKRSAMASPPGSKAECSRLTAECPKINGVRLDSLLRGRDTDVCRIAETRKHRL